MRVLSQERSKAYMVNYAENYNELNTRLLGDSFIVSTYGSEVVDRLDDGWCNLFNAIWEKGIADEINEARMQLGFYSRSHVRLKDGDISDKLYQRILKNIYEETFEFPDWKIFDNERVVKMPNIAWRKDYIKINKEEEEK